MNANQLIEILTDLGLTEKEARIYFTTLSLGPSTILKIARASELKRTTVYSVVESLMQKGLMNIEIKGFKKLFIAENPEKLKSILEIKTVKLQDVMPEFLGLYNLKGGESFIRYYEGLNSIKTIYEDLLKEIRAGDDYLIISEIGKWLNLDPKYFQNFTERRAKLNLNIKILLQASEAARGYKKYEKNYNLKAKILPPHTHFRTNLVIIPRKLVIHQLTPPIMATVIENKSIIEMHQDLFNVIWDSIRD